ncbi:L-threonylcarbamoyladenylate synthase [Cohnella luojiensis]|uniref:Threonylcarbamoyl-AMP synthase n=1 Tax=Cohnella luojiensis TaxID=652876 RepID=A0A4Y8M1F1_9BACL|nr:L-threonylcarbamoyladenylate synthase [Cohnella luojiensis]TFE28953.1 threonylcarbamoyl-AMP synthase [Cohnella luojiensis]
MTVTTKYWPAEQTRSGIIEAAAVLAAGGIIAFPTETVYGLGGDARSTEAVERIFAAKGRPSDNPLIVHIARSEDVEKLAERINDLERELMSAFWPGPLTLVLPVLPGAVSNLVTAGLDTVAVRVPAHEVARELIEQSGCPLAAPSANRSGRPSPTQARHVMEDLNGRIDGVVDGGETGVGLESTVVRVVDGKVHILRPGGITREKLQDAVGSIADVVSPESTAHSAEVASEAEQTHAPRSPGVKYAHYAPKGEMLLITGEWDKLVPIVQAKAAAAGGRGCKVAILSSTEHVARYQADAVFDCGPREEPEKAAHSLYALLRECDELGVNYIVAEGYPEEGIGAALMNRLRKAAGGCEITAG